MDCFFRSLIAHHAKDPSHFPPHRSPHPTLSGPDIWLGRRVPIQASRQPVIVRREVDIWGTKKVSTSKFNGLSALLSCLEKLDGLLTFLTPGIQAGNLDACRPGRFGAVVCDVELCAVDVELRVHDVGEDVLEADEVFSGGGCGGDGEVPLLKNGC